MRVHDTVLHQKLAGRHPNPEGPMNQNNSEKTPVQPPPNPAPAAGKWILKAIIVAVVVAVLAVTGYSVYVAKHEPDPQETIVLGQTRLAAGSPAAFRVLVRNRVSAVPVKGAEVAMSLTAPAGQVTRLGVFRTDDSGSIAEPVKIPELAPGEYQLVIDSRSPLGATTPVCRRTSASANWFQTSCWGSCPVKAT